MKTTNPKILPITRAKRAAPDAALLQTVEELMNSADHGQLAAEARVLAALFGLAALHLAGDAREKAEELRAWYSEEADQLRGLDAEAAPLRFAPIFLSTPRPAA